MSIGLPILVSRPPPVWWPESPLPDTTRPTRTVFALMPTAAPSTASVLVSEETPALAAPYAPNPLKPAIAWPEEMLTIDAPPAVPAAARCGQAYLDAQNTLPVSVPMRILSHSSVV